MKQSAKGLAYIKSSLPGSYYDNDIKLFQPITKKKFDPGNQLNMEYLPQITHKVTCTN